MPKSKKGRTKRSQKKSPKICKSTQDLNPITNRCNLKCKHGMERRVVNFKCIKSCILPQVRSQITNRCIKPKPSPKRKRVRISPRRNPVRLVRKPKSPTVQRDCAVCLEPTFHKTFCTSGRRHPLCIDCYYRLLEVGIHYCPTCREYMDRPPGL